MHGLRGPRTYVPDGTRSHALVRRVSQTIGSL